MSTAQGDTTFLNQVTAMQREITGLRARTIAQADTIGLLKKQYADLAVDHSAMLLEFKTKIHEAYTDRDMAERKASEVKAILAETTASVMQALRAMNGDGLAEAKQHAVAAPVAPVALVASWRDELEGTKLGNGPR